jgi:hypothetical protein
LYPSLYLQIQPASTTINVMQRKTALQANHQAEITGGLFLQTKVEIKYRLEAGSTDKTVFGFTFPYSKYFQKL